MKTHMQGDRVYSLSGHEGECVGKIENGPYLVRPVLECYDEDRSYTDLGHIQEWEEIFDRAPVELIDERITMKEDQLAEVQAKLDERQKEIRDTDQQYKERIKLIQRHKGLEYLEDILEGRFTHYIVFNGYGYAPEIQELKDTLTAHDNNWRKDLRPLILRANVASGEVKWSLAQYNDGSGSCADTIPCRSLEEAMTKLAEWLDNTWRGFRESAVTDGAGFASLVLVDAGITSAIKYGISVPDDIQTASTASKLRNIKSRMEGLNKQKTVIQAELDALVQP